MLWGVGGGGGGSIHGSIYSVIPIVSVSYFLLVVVKFVILTIRSTGANGEKGSHDLHTDHMRDHMTSTKIT